MALNGRRHPAHPAHPALMAPMALTVRTARMALAALAAAVFIVTAVAPAAADNANAPIPATATARPSAAEEIRPATWTSPPSRAPALADIPNPHWRAGGCAACHRPDEEETGATLNNADLNELCLNCHGKISAHAYIHAVGMAPSAEKQRRMNQSLKRAVTRGGGKITCITCHDLTLQCHPEATETRKANPRFFRDGPYANRSELCYACHDPSHYARLNPHDQITDEGDLNTQVCLVCHDVAPNRKEVKSIADVGFNVTANIARLCTGCHPWRPHPSSMFFRSGFNNHLIEPSDEIRRYMKKTEQREQVILPLDPGSGEIVCATCHNPHERGVLTREAADRGADSQHRLRTEGLVCMACHEL